MRKIDLIYGALIGIATALAGCFIFIMLFTDYTFMEGMALMREKGYLGKIITLGAALNLVAFFLLLHYKRELMARGVVFATIVLTIITLFV